MNVPITLLLTRSIGIGWQKQSYNCHKACTGNIINTKSNQHIICKLSANLNQQAPQTQCAEQHCISSSVDWHVSRQCITHEGVCWAAQNPTQSWWETLMKLTTSVWVWISLFRGVNGKGFMMLSTSVPLNLYRNTNGMGIIMLYPS